MIEDENRDDDVIDPEDDEIEIEDEELDEEEEEKVDDEEEEEEKSDVTAFGFALAFIPEDEALDESLDDDSGITDDAPTAEEIAEAEVPRKYRILSPIPMGNGEGEYQAGIIAEFPTFVGDLYVEEGRAERVQ